MGPIDRRERERLALRARIMETARALFAEKGYEAVTMRMIAEAIEYSPRTLYLHFQDKDDLLWQLCMEDYANFGQGMVGLRQVKDPVERLTKFGVAYADFARTHPHHYKLMFMASCHHVEPQPETQASESPENDAYLMLVECIQEAIDRGCLLPHLKDAHLIAQVVWAAIHGVVALEITHGHEPIIPWAPLNQRVQASIDLIQQGLLKGRQ